MSHRIAGFVLVAMLAFAGTAQANELDQFQNARAAYDSLNYELAAALFTELLADAAPDDRRPLIIESRKYLAASDLFVGRDEEAKHQFRLLLQVDPEYVLDPLAFPQEVQSVFVDVKAQLAAERKREAERIAREQAERLAAQRRAAEIERARMARLVSLARIERTRESRSRWIAAIPFGAGQFQNGHDDLGLVLAITEGVLLAGSITAYAFHENLRGQVPAPDRRDDARLAEGIFRYANQISFGLFCAVAIAGVLDAQLRFEGTHVTERIRPLPPDLEGLGKPTAASVPIGASYAISF